jgi:hypothetical protein
MSHIFLLNTGRLKHVTTNPDKPAQPQARAGTKRDKIILKSFCRQLFCLLKSLPKNKDSIDKTLTVFFGGCDYFLTTGGCEQRLQR